MWGWGFNRGVLCTRFSRKGRLHRPLSAISACRLCCADEAHNKAEIAVHGCHYLGDMAMRMPRRGLVFECVTCFYCSKGVIFVLDCVRCVPIPIKKDDPPLWVAEN